MEAVKINDIVEFTIKGEVVKDVVRYVSSEVIEGEKYDLTHIRFKVLGDDLFEHQELIPEKIMTILERFSEDEIGTYDGCTKLQKELEENGYTMDFDLGACPYGLKRVELVD